ncbi:MAG TPA: hypothetical protein VFF30_01450 [Nitrososphaerales archaeon]|nr:hypothetical protein [Nitrososphaerales archaeon]
MLEAFATIAYAAVGGFVAAVCMSIFEIPFWREWGMEGVTEWQINSVMASMIFRAQKKSVKVRYAVAMHLLHGVILGVIYLLLLLLLLPGLAGTPLSILESAIFYNLLLWLVSPFATRRFFESKGRFKIIGRGLVISFLSHIIYGAVLGVFIAQLF